MPSRSRSRKSKSRRRRSYKKIAAAAGLGGVGAATSYGVYKNRAKIMSKIRQLLKLEISEAEAKKK